MAARGADRIPVKEPLSPRVNAVQDYVAIAHAIVPEVVPD